MSILFQGKTVAGNFGIVTDSVMYHAKLDTDGKTYIVQEDLKFVENTFHLIHFDKTNTDALPILKFGWLSGTTIENAVIGRYSYEITAYTGNSLPDNYIKGGVVLLIGYLNLHANKVRLMYPIFDFDLDTKATKTTDFVTPITVTNKGVTMKELNAAAINTLKLVGYITSTIPEDISSYKIGSMFYINDIIGKPDIADMSVVKILNEQHELVDKQYIAKDWDVWKNINNGDNWYWIGNDFQQTSFTVDFTPYRTAEEQDIIDHQIHVANFNNMNHHNGSPDSHPSILENITGINTEINVVKQSVTDLDNSIVNRVFWKKSGNYILPDFKVTFTADKINLNTIGGNALVFGTSGKDIPVKTIGGQSIFGTGDIPTAIGESDSYYSPTNTPIEIGDYGQEGPTDNLITNGLFVEIGTEFSGNTGNVIQLYDWVTVHFSDPDYVLEIGDVISIRDLSKLGTKRGTESYTFYEHRRTILEGFILPGVLLDYADNVICDIPVCEVLVVEDHSQYLIVAAYSMIKYGNDLLFKKKIYLSNYGFDDVVYKATKSHTEWLEPVILTNIIRVIVQNKIRR